MALKPIDVRRKEFKNSMRGYNADQVDDFLDTVADEFERSYSENLRMREEISSLRERLEQFEKLESSIQSALVHAESAANDLRDSASSEAENVRNNANREAENVRNNANREAENVRNNANREAEFTVKEAEERSQQILAEASSKVERANESYEALKKAKQDFAADFRHLLKSYIAVMDNVDLVSAKEIEASLRERLDWEAIAAARETAEKQSSEGNDEETQAMEAVTGPLSEDEAEPEVEEPEVEPSSVEDKGQEAVSADSEAFEEVEREESSPDRGNEGGSEEDNGAPSDDSNQERQSRASRFLRRRA